MVLHRMAEATVFSTNQSGINHMPTLAAWLGSLSRMGAVERKSPLIACIDPILAHRLVFKANTAALQLGFSQLDQRGKRGEGRMQIKLAWSKYWSESFF